MPCNHELAEQESACADGMRPLCSAYNARRFRAALEAIAGGVFPDVSTMAVAKDWLGMYEALQTIARTALDANHPSPISLDNSSRETHYVECWREHHKCAIAEIERLRPALVKLRIASVVLLQNAEGCALNHFGNDPELHGVPGWIYDCKKDIDAATAALSK